MIRSRIRCLQSLGKYQSLIVSKSKQLIALRLTQGNRRLAYDMFSRFKRRLHVLEMIPGVRKNKHGIRRLQQLIIAVHALISLQFGRSATVGVKDAANRHAINVAHLCGLLDHFLRAAYESQPKRRTIGPQLRARNALRPVQIHNLAELGKIIEVATPVGPDGKHVNVEPLDVVNLLTFIFLDDNLIRKTRFTNVLDSLRQRLGYVDFSTHLVETVGRHTDDKVIAQRLRPLQ